MASSPLVEAQSLVEEAGNGNRLIVDCRFSLQDPSWGYQSYLESTFGQVYAHLDRDLSGPVIPGKTGRHPLPDVDKLARTFGEWGIDGDTRVIAFDDCGGPFAARLWWLLRWMGHEEVSVLNGGWSAYLESGGALRPGRENPPRPVRAFCPALQDEMLLDASGVLRVVEDIARTGENSSSVLLDARAFERFSGEQEPIDREGGHIPGAVSVPFKENLNAQGRFQDDEHLAQRFTKKLAGKAPERAIAYCGSGVTACHNLLAMEQAGLKGAKLYLGSWSEWIEDPSRPRAKGEK